MEKYLKGFIERVQAEELSVEGIAIYLENRLAVSHRFVPDTPRCIYSHTKSFMSTAVGLAVSDGLLSLTDKPADFFPEAVPKDADPRVRNITLHDLLCMASGFGAALLMADGRKNGEGAPDYARYVFSQPMKHAPGEKFCYSNGDSYLAGLMVEHATGKSLAQIWQERLFDPMDIKRPTVETCPMGHTFGASGLFLGLLDMMKLGRLFDLGGKWEGKQLVDPAWISMATKKHIETGDLTGNPWNIGYGYQFWMLPYPGAYRADGAYGQLTLVMPEKGAVIGIQSTESDKTDRILAALREEVADRL